MIIPFLAVFLLGLSKAGFKGLGFFVVVLLAMVYDAKASTGILMPLLIFADCLAIIYYKKHVKWTLLGKLLPPMIVGILVAVFIGDSIPNSLFKKLMAGIILISGLSMFFIDKIDSTKFSDNKPMAYTIGFLAGFATMIGNLAGGFANLYFLALKLPKEVFIGTSAWLFFFVNLFKLPFHVLTWQTVNTESSLISLKLIPVTILGFIVGIYLIKYISNSLFKRYIIFITIIGALLIYFK